MKKKKKIVQSVYGKAKDAGNWKMNLVKKVFVAVTAHSARKYKIKDRLLKLASVLIAADGIMYVHSKGQDIT